MKHYILIGLMIWNLTVFFLYAMDKYRAKSGGWRVPERTLIACAFCLGGIGAAAGMGLLRHKTRHLGFRLLIPLALVITVAVVVSVQWPEVVAGVIGADSWLGRDAGGVVHNRYLLLFVRKCVESSV